MFLNYNKLGKKTPVEPEFKNINKAVRQGMRHLSVQGQDVLVLF